MRARRVLALAAGLGLAAGVAGAAPRRASPLGFVSPELFAGYSYTAAGEASLHGLGLSGSYPLGTAFHLVVDLSVHGGSYAGADLGQLGFMAGARFSPLSGRFRPFAEGLLGGVRTSASVTSGDVRIDDADTDWGLALGGGLDYGLNERWALRALFQLRLLHGDGTWDSDPRFAVGAVYRLRR
jgi:opacity protein-like surface antigen